MSPVCLSCMYDYMYVQYIYLNMCTYIYLNIIIITFIMLQLYSDSMCFLPYIIIDLQFYCMYIIVCMCFLPYRTKAGVISCHCGPSSDCALVCCSSDCPGSSGGRFHCEVEVEENSFL